MYLKGKDLKDLKEKDLRLTVRAEMTVSEQCGITATKGNQIIRLIKRNIVYKKELIIPLYETIVRPHLEYGIQAWRPYRKIYIYMLQRVQREQPILYQNSGILVMKCV